MEDKSYEEIVEKLLYKPFLYIKDHVAITHTSKFDSPNNNIPEYALFENNFFELYNNIIKFDSITAITLSESYQLDNLSGNDNIFEKILNYKSKNIIYKLSENFVKCFDNIFIEKHWNNLKRINKGLTCTHTFLTLVLIYVDCKYGISNKDLVSKYDLNILLWTMLFHDICKYISLNDSLKENFKCSSSCNDSSHPFKSAALTIKLLFENNFFDLESYDSKFLNDSVKENKLENEKGSEIFEIISKTNTIKLESQINDNHTKFGNKQIDVSNFFYLFYLFIIIFYIHLFNFIKKD